MIFTVITLVLCHSILLGLGAMPTALRGHENRGNCHAHARPWAWHTIFSTLKFSCDKALGAAERDFTRILEFIAARSKTGAMAWARAFDKALSYLEEHAESCSLAAENDHVDFEVRETLFKTRRGLIYRILFTIREKSVFILHVRGPGQDLVAALELQNPN